MKNPNLSDIISKSSSFTMGRYCRVCARSYAILEPISENGQLAMELQRILHIIVSKHNTLPKFICNPCKEKIVCLRDFHSHVQATQRKFITAPLTNVCRVCGCFYKNSRKLLMYSKIHSKLAILFKFKIKMEDDVNRIICEPCEDAINFNWELWTDAQRNQIILEKMIGDGNGNVQEEEEMDIYNDLVSELDEDDMKINETAKYSSEVQTHKQKVMELSHCSPLHCSLCIASPVTSDELIIHYKNVLTSIPQSLCRICDQKCNKNKPCPDSKEHRRKSVCYCICCRKSWSSPIRRQKHERSKYEIYLKHRQCHQCWKIFETANALKYHITLYGKYHLFSCEFCNKSFVEKEDGNTHRETHSTNALHTCRICKQRFTSLGKLSAHEMGHRQHFMLEGCPFLCIVCGKRFQTITQIKRHLSKHEFHEKVMSNNSLPTLLEHSIFNLP